MTLVSFEWLFRHHTHQLHIPQLQSIHPLSLPDQCARSVNCHTFLHYIQSSNILQPSFAALHVVAVTQFQEGSA